MSRNFGPIFLIAVLILASVILPGDDCIPARAQHNSQSRYLPKAGFQSFSGNLPKGSGSGMTAGGMPSNTMSIPGVHLTTGMQRTASNLNEPYNPGEPSLNNALARWERSKMPLRIWISPGLQLPEAPFDQLMSIRPQQVQALVQDGSIADLSVAQGWTPETNFQVASGISLWKQFEDEGLLAFGYVREPEQAQILVFFVDQFKQASGPGGLNVGGLTCSTLYTLEQARELERRRTPQMPVVIELATMINHDAARMQASAAHEFGHALGIKAHSPYREDIMYADRISTILSEGDKATLRLLYRAQPKYVM